MTDDIEKEIQRRVQEQLAKATAKPTKKRKQVKLPTILNKEQIASILEWFNEDTRTGFRNKTYFLFLIRNCLRASEALNIRFEDIKVTVDSEGKTVMFYRLQTSKNGMQADIPLSQDTYDRFLKLSKLFKSNKKGYIFRTVKANKLMTGSYFRRLANTIGNDLGFHLNLHQFRHFGLSLIYFKTQDVKIVQKVARHQSLNSSEVYIHVQPEAVRKATELIEF